MTSMACSPTRSLMKNAPSSIGLAAGLCSLALATPMLAQTEPGPAPSAPLVVAPAPPEATAPPQNPAAMTTPALVPAPAPAAASDPAPGLQVSTAAPVARPAAAPDAPPPPWYRVRAVAELGFLAVLSHKLQLGRDGTYFDYVSEGGQDNLYAVGRMSLELELKRRHTFVFLYQPLDLETSVVLPRAVRMAGADFEQGTPVDLRYAFPFYRASYLYDLAPSPKHELSLGLSMQIRNATIDFASRDGETFTSNRDIGPVPILKSRGRYAFDGGAFLGYEVDGFYAPISVINGSDNEVTGAIVDLSLRGGVALPENGEMFLNLRYLAGGAVGQSDKEPQYDGYTRNWLHFMTVSIGAAIGTP